MSDDENPLVTATVTPPPPTTAPLPENFSIPAAVSLARDLAHNMYDLPVVLKKHNVTQLQYAKLQENAWFRQVQEQLAMEWASPRSAQERLATYTAVGLEVTLPDAIARVSAKNEPLQAVAQMVKVLAEIAGANAAAKKTAPPTEKFTITINLGNDTETYEKSVPTAIDILPAEATEVRPVPEGPGNLITLSPEPEKT